MSDLFESPRTFALLSHAEINAIKSSLRLLASAFHEERIAKGKYNQPCNDCAGIGKKIRKTVAAISSYNDKFENCFKCKGKGFVVNAFIENLDTTEPFKGLPEFSVKTIETAQTFITLLEDCHAASIPIEDAILAKHKYNIDYEG
jgi:hypothetical protein